MSKTLSNTNLKYLGILGPQKRTNRLLQDLKYEDISLANCELYSPVGLDIGADSPEAIALSIIAEIQAVTQNRQGGFLRNRLMPIHSDKVEVASRGATPRRRQDGVDKRLGRPQATTPPQGNAHLPKGK